MTDVPVLLVRFVPGVPEELRDVHVVPAYLMTSNLMVACCGTLFLPGTAERLNSPTGAVCKECASVARAPGSNALPPHEVTTVISQAPTTPPAPEAQTVLDKVRTLAVGTLTVHTNQGGRCTECDCAYPCAPARLADHNLALLY